MPHLTGLHHVTAVTARPRQNRAFWEDGLGMRLVKRTVNQDDTSAWHLFYADRIGSPGTDMTFFHWNAAPEQRGHGAPERTGLRVADRAALDFWAARIARIGGRASGIDAHDGFTGLDAEDPEGQRLRIVIDPEGPPSQHWEDSDVPQAHRILGLGPVRLAVADPGPTDAFLTGPLSMTRDRSYSENGDAVQVYRMDAPGAAGELHVAHRPGLRRSRQGAGGVHHVAFRAPDRETLDAWEAHLADSGIRTSGEIDRHWFRSLYFREPGGTLFEIATDGPGFTVDEPEASLGQSLVLPPFLEMKRAAIAASLPPID